MSRPEKSLALSGRIEVFLRRLFERIGGALDFALRRPLNPQPRTDLTALVPPIERAIEERLRRESTRIIAPNLIELRYDYETYSQMTESRRDYLQRELRATVYEYIHNRRYATEGDVQVKVGFDIFTRKLIITAAFPDEVEAPVATPQPAAEAKPAVKRCQVGLRMLSGRRLSDLHARMASDAAPSGIGRSHDNPIVIEDSTVSNFHAAFTLLPNGALWLADLGSSNGTFVNGVRLAGGDKSIVRSGDRLRFGDVEATLEVKDEG
jgi:hypothetical protein